jgi:hypothetical protein
MKYTTGKLLESYRGGGPNFRGFSTQWYVSSFQIGEAVRVTWDLATPPVPKTTPKHGFAMIHELGVFFK